MDVYASCCYLLSSTLRFVMRSSARVRAHAQQRSRCYKISKHQLIWFVIYKSKNLHRHAIIIIIVIIIIIIISHIYTTRVAFFLSYYYPPASRVVSKFQNAFSRGVGGSSWVQTMWMEASATVTIKQNINNINNNNKPQPYTKCL